MKPEMMLSEQQLLRQRSCLFLQFHISSFKHEGEQFVSVEEKFNVSMAASMIIKTAYNCSKIEQAIHL